MCNVGIEIIEMASQIPEICCQRLLLSMHFSIVISRKCFEDGQYLFRLRYRIAKQICLLLLVTDVGENQWEAPNLLEWHQIFTSVFFFFLRCYTKIFIFSVTEYEKVNLADTAAVNFPVDISRSIAYVETKRFYSY